MRLSRFSVCRRSRVAAGASRIGNHIGVDAGVLRCCVVFATWLLLGIVCASMKLSLYGGLLSRVSTVLEGFRVSLRVGTFSMSILASDLARFGLSEEACVVAERADVYCVSAAQDGRVMAEYFATGRVTTHLGGHAAPPEVDEKAVRRLVKASAKVRSAILHDKYYRNALLATGAPSLLVLAGELFASVIPRGTSRGTSRSLRSWIVRVIAIRSRSRFGISCLCVCLPVCRMARAVLRRLCSASTRRREVG